MGAVSVQTISMELMLACRQLGHVVSETLAALIASTIVNPSVGSFYVDRPMDENDARLVVEEAARRILSKEQPGIVCLRLQSSYEGSMSEIERDTQRQRAGAKAAEDRAVNYISGFTAKFDEDFDTLTKLYKKIYTFLLLRCTAPLGSSKPPSDPAVEREVAAALESVFPRVGLRSFAALSGAEKAAQLQELAGIVLGIRLFNSHQGKGGVGLPAMEGVIERLQSMELLEKVQAEVDELNELCKSFVDFILAAKGPQRGSVISATVPPSDGEIERARSDLLYHRQYLCYLLSLQEDLTTSIERLKKDQKNLNEELSDLDALIGGRVSVPKEQVYPRFDSLARGYRTVFQEVQLLEARGKLHGVLAQLRKEYFPKPPEAAAELLSQAGHLTLLEDGEAEGQVDLSAIPGPGSAQDGAMGGAVLLTLQNAPDFLQLPLDFHGFCLHTLVTRNRLLVPGNPQWGVAKYAGRYCVFATEKGCAEFCAEPDRFFGSVREICYKHPELIHLLRIHEDFPKSSLHAIVQMTAGSSAVMQADQGTETPLHFEESNIDKNYEWNEWSMRRDALHMADIRRKSTSATQTALSHLRRESESQVYLPKDVATNTTVNRGTNPPRLRKYYTCIRGEPEPMKVSTIKYDLKPIVRPS